MNLRNKISKQRTSINSHSSEPKKIKKGTSNKKAQMSIQREQEKNVNQLKLIDNKIAKSDLASNEERLGNVGNNAIEDKKQKDMVLNSLLADTNVDNMILEALKQEIGREITDPNTLRKDLSSNPINYIYFFNNLITINLYSLESRTNIKSEEEIINVDNQTLLGCEDLCEEFEWLYQPYTEFIMESFTYGQNELEYNQNLNSKEYNRLHKNGFSDYEINWIMAWIMDMKINRPDDSFSYEFILRQYKNIENCKRNENIDKEMYNLLHTILSEGDFILKVIAALKVNPLIKRTVDEGIKEIINRIILFKEIHSCIEKNKEILQEEQICILSDILSYICLQMICMNFEYTKSQKYILGNELYHKLNEEEIQKRNEIDNTFAENYKNEVRIEEEYFKIKHNESFRKIQTAISFVCSKLRSEISTEGRWRKIISYINLLHEAYYKLIDIEKFKYLFNPYTIQNLSKEKEDIIQKELKEQIKIRFNLDSLSVFDKIWEHYNCIIPNTIKNHKSDIQNEYYNLHNLNMTLLARKYIRGATFILNDTLMLSDEEFEFMQLTICIVAILSEFKDKIEINLFKEKLKELSSDHEYIQIIISNVLGQGYVREQWPSYQLDVTNTNLLSFFTSIYIYLLKNRSRNYNIENENFDKEYQFIIHNKEIDEVKKIITVSDTEKCIQNSINLSMNTQNKTDMYHNNMTICKRILEALKFNINEFYKGDEEEYQSIYRTIMANNIGIEYLLSKEYLDNDKECNVCLGYCNDTCLYSNKSNNQKCPYFNSNNDISMCIYCKNISSNEHNIGYLDEYQDINKRASYLGKHTISTCGLFKNKIQRYVDIYIRSCIEGKKKIHVLDCISSFILSVENGIVQYLIKQNNKILRISWELINAIYKYATNYINANLFNILSELKYNYDTTTITIKPKTYLDIQNWVYYIAINLNNFEQKIMNKIKVYLDKTKDMSWKRWIDNQTETWNYITELEIKEYKFINEEFIWIQQLNNDIFRFKMNDNDKLKITLHDSTKFIGNKRKIVNRWKNLDIKNTIGSNTISQLDELFLKSTTGKNSNKRKILDLKGLRELTDKKLKERKEKDKMLEDEYKKIQGNKDMKEEMDYELNT